MDYTLSLNTLPHLRLIGKQSYEKGWKKVSCPRGNVLFLMIDGEFTFTTDKETLSAKKGDILLFKKRSTYKVCAEENCTYFYLHFTGDILDFDEARKADSEALILPNKLSLSSLSDKYDRFLWLFALCERISKEKPIYESLRLDNILCEILIQKASVYAEKRLENIPPSIKRIENFIKSSVSMPITLTDISEKFSISKQYIMRSFKRYYGISVTHKINQEKLNYSLTLLRESDLTLEEVSTALAYSSSGYFCRLFKQYFSLTPSEYRRQIEE